MNLSIYRSKNKYYIKKNFLFYLKDFIHQNYFSLNKKIITTIIHMNKYFILLHPFVLNKNLQKFYRKYMLKNMYSKYLFPFVFFK